MADLVDCGERKVFDTGGMREIIDGKGRCDLLPLDIISTLLGGDYILVCIHKYIYTGETEELYTAIRDFIELRGWDMYTAMLKLSKHYEDGARKYADRNWEKGLPLHSFIDSGVRHYFKFLRGDMDEPHDRAFMWNLIGALRTQLVHPDLIDLPFADTAV